jgi:PPOX class probable F420-dependent enzyme
MPKAPVPATVAEVLARPNLAVICVVRPDGQPVSVATWYVWEEGRILVNMHAQRKRAQYMHVGSPVSLTVLKEGDWTSHVSVQGRIASIKDDPDIADMDRITRHYTNEPFSWRDEPRVSVWVEVDHWHAWGSWVADPAD